MTLTISNRGIYEMCVVYVNKWQRDHFKAHCISDVLRTGTLLLLGTLSSYINQKNICLFLKKMITLFEKDSECDHTVTLKELEDRNV